jgi:hypothetical protein
MRRRDYLVKIQRIYNLYWREVCFIWILTFNLFHCKMDLPRFKPDWSYRFTVRHGQTAWKRKLTLPDTTGKVLALTVPAGYRLSPGYVWYKHTYLSSIAKQVLATNNNNFRVRFLELTSTGVIWRNTVVTRLGLELWSLGWDADTLNRRPPLTFKNLCLN